MEAGSYQQLSAFSGDVTSILGTYVSAADHPNTKRQSALWLWSSAGTFGQSESSWFMAAWVGPPAGGNRYTRPRSVCRSAERVPVPRHQLRLSFLHLLRAERWVCCPKWDWTGFLGLVRRQQMNPINQLQFWYVHSFEPDIPSYHRSSEYFVIAGRFLKQTYLTVMYISGVSKNIHIVIFGFVSGRFEADIILATHLHMKNSLI